MNKTYIIAEAGVNHNGSLKLAKDLVDLAIEAKVDAVKFQSFIPSEVISKNTPKCAYQNENTGSDESQLEMVEKLQLSGDEQEELFAYARSKGIEILSTPFDFPSLNLLQKLEVSRLKIPSGEVTNAPLLLEIAKSGKPIIMSTGMCVLEEIEDALGVLAFGLLNNGQPPGRENFKKAFASPEGRQELKKYVSILHCTSEYPAPFNEINLRAMDLLNEKFGLPVGYSDHSEGVSVPVAAVARGATIIEKHYTLDKQMEGPDHLASLDPAELKNMVKLIREVEQALGEKFKKPSATEEETKKLVRKSLVAGSKIAEGETFNKENLKLKRPGLGVDPFSYWEYLGKPADKSYAEDELIGK